ncbi:fas-activated serine/threonine kinase-like, partial [Numida meleagris]|uniref:fas-activated serine/threonine kinase-like n=1 Tax=Numida meleagris TaxID=8996 RepID=UPI000B3DC076
PGVGCRRAGDALLRSWGAPRLQPPARGNTALLPLLCPCRVVLSVNDKWHYCQNSDILVGSRAMRDRHLRLLGYCLVQLPYTELEKVSGIEEAKHYLRQKLRELRF